MVGKEIQFFNAHVYESNCDTEFPMIESTDVIIDTQAISENAEKVLCIGKSENGNSYHRLMVTMRIISVFTELCL